MSDQKLEPFPPVMPLPRGNNRANAPRPRRKSSGLGGDPRGDTGAGSIATLADFSPASTPSVAEESLPRRSKRRKARSLLRRYVRISLRHTWLNPLIIVLLILGLYAVNPSTSNPFYSCIFLSYPIAPSLTEKFTDAPIQYGKGKADFAFVAFYAVVLSFTREFFMQRLIRPLAISYGIKSRAKQARFMEQFYTAIYFGIFGPFGLYVMSRTPVWYFNTTGMFEGFPHRTHEAVFKAYYLLQASYWAQQGLVLLLMLEKPRKDFKELVIHHIVTLALIWLSYRFHFTYMGIAVYITHDISDFFLATSKVLNYIDSPITTPYFILFIGAWAYLRHYINLHILYATLTEFRTVGPFELNWETQQYKCWISQYITFGLLAALQAVNIFWFTLICRILYRFAVARVVEDTRSDDEDAEADELEREEQRVQAKEAADENAKLGRQKMLRESAPEVRLNGEPVSATSGVEQKESVRSRRKG